MQVAPGGGGGEEGGVKVNLFRKKNLVGSKMGAAGTFMFAKKVHQKYKQICIVFTFKVLQ